MGGGHRLAPARWTAIMQALWKANSAVTIRDIRHSPGCHRPVAYSTVATVTNILCRKGLARRDLGDPAGQSGSRVWWYHAARSQTGHTGELFAALPGHSPTPAAALAHALSTARSAQWPGGAVGPGGQERDHG